VPNLIHPKERPLRVTRVRSKRIEVTFALECHGAQDVFLSGDFNDWSPAGLRMIRLSQNGLWKKRVVLEPGRYEYKFVMDGKWIHDSRAGENVANASGSLNSVLEVPT
jgi:1,4-alpha-glucan branching enzyme